MAIVDSGQTNLSKGFQDDYKTWYGDKSGAAPGTSLGAGTPSAIGPAPPDESIQYNNVGRFGGSEWFKFKNKVGQLSVAAGEDSSFDAALYSHCYIFGKNCHVVDP